MALNLCLAGCLTYANVCWMNEMNEMNENFRIPICISHLSIVGSKYLTCTAHRRKGLFWLGDFSLWQAGSKAKRWDGRGKLVNGSRWEAESRRAREEAARHQIKSPKPCLHRSGCLSVTRGLKPFTTELHESHLNWLLLRSYKVAAQTKPSQNRNKPWLQDPFIPPSESWPIFSKW